MSPLERDIIITLSSTAGFIILMNGFFISLIYNFQKRLQKKNLEKFNAVINAQEKEQERIARDLHDEIGPALTIINSQIQSFGNGDLSEIDSDIKRDTIDQIQWTIKEIRIIAHNLIPATFTENGFLTSLKHYVIRLQEYTQIEVKFNCPKWPADINAGHEISLFRIIQELFQNTIKHANASQIELTLLWEKKKLSMVYRDNGVGIVRNGKTHEKHMGFQNIESRVELIGGTYSLQSKPGEGCCFDFNFHFKN